MLGNLLAESVTTPAWKSKEQGFVGGGKNWQAEALLINADHLPEENLLNVNSI